MRLSLVAWGIILAGTPALADTNVLIGPNFEQIPANQLQVTINGQQNPTTLGVALQATGGGGVSSFNSRSGAVTLTSSDVTGALAFTPYNSSNPSGYQTAGNVSSSLASYAPLASPALTGTPTVPTATAGTNTTQAASTAFVQSAVAGGTAGVSSFNTRTGAVTLTSSDVTTALTFTPANIASPTFTGVPAAPTATAGTSTTQLATTAFVQAAVTGGTAGVASFNTRTGAVTLTSSDVTTALTYTPANTVSPTFTGTPAAPTAAAGTNTTQLATTAFVVASQNVQLPSGTTSQLYGGTGAAGTAQVITLGTNLSITGTTLNATGGAGSGTVNTGTVNGIAYYPAATAAVSPITTANSSMFITSSGGVPSWSTTTPASITYPTPIFTGLANAAQIELGGNALAMATGMLGFAKTTAIGTAPGATGAALQLVCGTNAGTAKIIATAGTSTTAVTLIDNIGAGVTGC